MAEIVPQLHTTRADTQVPSRDLEETQSMGTSGPDIGARSPAVAHLSETQLDNTRWKQEAVAQWLWWETHQRTR